LVIKINKMDILKSLTNLLKRRKTLTPDDVPEGFCPNCWGRQEYGGKLYEAIKNENVDIETLSSKKGWIQEYADKHLGAIQLKYEDDMLVCRKCKLTYQPT